MRRRGRGEGGHGWRSPAWEYPMVDASFHAWPIFQAALLLFHCCVCPRGRGSQPAAAGAETIPKGGGATASWEKGWWWVLFVWSWVYPALAQPSQNVIGLSLSALESLFKMLWMHFKMLTSETHCIYLFPWTLKPQSNCSSSVASEPAQNLLFGLRTAPALQVPSSPLKLNQFPSPRAYIKDIYSFIRYHWRSFSRPLKGSLRFSFSWDAQERISPGLSSLAAPVPRSEPRRHRVALPRLSGPARRDPAARGAALLPARLTCTGSNVAGDGRPSPSAARGSGLGSSRVIPMISEDARAELVQNPLFKYGEVEWGWV